MSQDSVFAAYDQLPARSLTEAAYQTLTLFSHRDWLDQATIHQILERASVPGKKFAGAAWRKRLLGAVQQIETLEGKSLSHLTDDELRKYRKELNELLFRKLSAAYPSSEAAGRAMLEELRKTVPRGQRSTERDTDTVESIHAAADAEIPDLSKTPELAVSGD